jgi:hypothetical protein
MSNRLDGVSFATRILRTYSMCVDNTRLWPVVCREAGRQFAYGLLTGSDTGAAGIC